MTDTPWADFQYAACTILGYSLKEYRVMTVGQINEQLEVHAATHNNQSYNDSYTEGVEF